MEGSLDGIKFGWLPDYPDFRDFTPETTDVPPSAQERGVEESVHATLKKIGVAGPEPLNLPTSVDLRPWCSPIEDQQNLGSCTAQAAVGLVEYYYRRAYGKHLDESRLFVYKTTRNLLRWVGDTGAFLRDTMKSLVLFGVPPEDYWPYNIARFDEEPPAFCYAFAQNYQALAYYRLDPPNIVRAALLQRIRTHLAAGLPSMFGFTVYSSINQAYTTGKIPFPIRGERVLGGHAVIAIGYDDTIKIKNATAGALEMTGAFLIRNSWGTSWGPNQGYLWLPYEYVLSGQAVDWWSLIRHEWVDLGQFKLTPSLQTEKV